MSDPNDTSATPAAGAATDTGAVPAAATPAEGATPAAGAPAATPAAAAPAAPENYTFDLPEGVQMPEEGLAAFSKFAKDRGMSQDDAQALLGELAPAMQGRQAQLLAQARADWQGRTKADAEIGGDKLNENIAVAKKALEQFGSPELTAMLNETGLGDHPDLVRAFYRVGKAISEDGFVASGAGRQSNAKDARSLYSASGMNP